MLGVNRRILAEHLSALVSSEQRVNQALNDRETAFKALIQLMQIKPQIACNYLDELVLEYHAQL